MTRDEALSVLTYCVQFSGDSCNEAIRVLSRPCIEIEGWEIRWDTGDGYDQDNEWRTIELKRRVK